MTDREVLDMPLDRHLAFIRYQNQYIKQSERAMRRR